jgi:predicted amidohydrolase YtcJ
VDLILKNGNILTMSRGRHKVQALAVRFDRIHGLGSTAEMAKLAGPDSRVVDLDGRTVLPGFIDTHNHFCLYAFLIDQVDCRPAAGCARSDDVIQALKERAERTPPGRWVMGWGYAHYLLEDKKELTRKDLDRASTRHPICLCHVSVHGAVVNSPALRRLGFSRNTPDPPGGRIHRDPAGAPNGVLSESAFMGPLFFASPSIYTTMMADYAPEARVDMMARCAARFNRLGIVGVHDPFVDSPTLQVYQQAADAGRLPVRIRAYVLNHWAQPLMASGIGYGFGSPWLRVGSIKIFLDGGMSSRTAAVSRPYESGGRGILNYTPAGIAREIRRFDRAGYPVSVHAQGDRALGILLDAFEKTASPGNPLRHHIVHAGDLTHTQIRRVKALGLYITSQANFLSLLGDGFMEAYGPIRSRSLYRFRTLRGKGIPLALSSDCPVADPDPLIGLRDAICRRTGTGRVLGPRECLEAQEALSMYTREAAFFSFEEGETGTLEEGKWADLVVLDRDPTAVPVQEIPHHRVRMTVVGGRVVHDELGPR